MHLLLRATLSGVCCTVQELDRWEERLEELFAGRPYDIYDAALTATISDFPVSIQPFRDMVGHGCLARPSPLHDIARASAAISGRHSRRSFSTSWICHNLSGTL